MLARDFAYWLQGFIELHKKPPNAAQWKMISNHLNLVFKHEIDTPDPTGELQAVHDGKPIPPKVVPVVDKPPVHPNYWPDRDPLIRC